MTDTTHKPDPEEFVAEPPAGYASPDDFVSNDQSAVVSEETGTVYERTTGEPAATPHDEKLEQEEEDEES